MSPTVTVITATFNSSSSLRLSLLSLLAQDFTDFEAWVIGDDCTDDSEQVVRSLGEPRLRWHNLPRNSGSQAAPNSEGLRRAAGRHIAFLGHDDLWFPGHLSGLVGAIEQTGADLVHSLCALVTPRGVEMAVGPPSQGRTYADHHAPPSTWLHRRELTDIVGLWPDPDRLSMGVDTAVLRRIHLAGRRIEFVPQLSVLKFPSAAWRTYGGRDQPPQAEHWCAMQEDASALERRALLDLAVALARRRDPLLPLRECLRQAHRTLRTRAIDLWGRDRWPLVRLLVGHHQRLRRCLRRDRGLPP